MKEKGFTLIELIITIVIIMVVGSIAIPIAMEFVRDEDLASKAGVFVREFKQEVDPEVRVETETVTIDRSGVNCLDGKKTITIDGVVYHLGKIKNSWGDLEAVDCQ
jgi:prepilin-type N-terminal cleavage/methylation domain-containing protein